MCKIRGRVPDVRVTEDGGGGRQRRETDKRS